METSERMAGSHCPVCGGAIVRPFGCRRDLRIAWGPRGAVRLTPMQAVIVEALMEHEPGFVSRDAFMDRLYGDRADGGADSDRIIDVFAHQLRVLLAPIGLTIAAKWGWGYQITHHSAPSDTSPSPTPTSTADSTNATRLMGGTVPAGRPGSPL